MHTCLCFPGDSEVFCTDASVHSACSFQTDFTQRLKNTKYPTGQKERGGQNWRFWNF